MKAMTKQKHLSLQQIFQSGKSALGRGDDLFSISKLNEIRKHLCIYEDADSIEWPMIVVPSGGDLESFFADIATYFPSFTPISAYVHVLDETLFQASLIQSEMPMGRSTSKHQLSTYIGLILGDALSAPRMTSQRTLLPSYSACKRTLAYCIARSSVLHPHLSTQEISSRWLKIRTLSGMDKSTNAAASICWAADLVNGNFSISHSQEMGELSKTLSKYFKGGVKRERVTESLISLYPHLPEKVTLQYGAYEKRIEDFNAIVSAVRQRSKGSELDSLCIAFFCNLILPGSFAHLGLIERLLPEMPDSMLWYGFFAGSSEEFSPASSVGGIGQKLLRDIVAPFSFSRRPTCDISLEEYEILARVPLRSENIKPTQAKAVLVSLCPGVEVYVRSAMEEDDGGEKQPRSQLSFEQDERALQVRHLLRQADQILSGERSGEPTVRTRAKATGKVKQSKG